MNDLYATIVSNLKKHADREGATITKRFHKYEGFECYGVQTSLVRQVQRQHKKDIQALHCKDALSLARKLFTSRIEEQAVVANYILRVKLDCLTLSQFDYLDRVSDNFRSWSTVDGFCAEGACVLQSLLSKYPRETLKLLRKWSKAKNMWKRRASVVPFTRKVGESGKFTKGGLELCDNLIWDREDLVQKAVGWALKDMMRGDKQKVFDYVKKIRRAGVPATITLYAIRDLKGKERQGVLSIE